MCCRVPIYSLCLNAHAPLPATFFVPRHGHINLVAKEESFLGFCMKQEPNRSLPPSLSLLKGNEKRVGLYMIHTGANE